MFLGPVVLLLIALLSCNREFENPLDPASRNYIGDSLLVDIDGNGIPDLIEEYSPDCLSVDCLDTALANRAKGLGRHPRLVALAPGNARARIVDSIRLQAEAVGLLPIHAYAWAKGADGPFTDTTATGEFRIAYADSGLQTVRVKALSFRNGFFASPESALAITVIRDVPIAVINGNMSVRVGDTLRLSGKGIQEFGHIVQYKWSDGIGADAWEDSSADSSTLVRFVSRGVHDIRLQVRDDIGNVSDTDRSVFVVNENPKFTSEFRDSVISAFDTLQLTVEASDPDGIRWYLWDLDGDGRFEDTTSTGAIRHVFPKASAIYRAKTEAWDFFDGVSSLEANFSVVADVPIAPRFDPVKSPTNENRPGWSWAGGGGGSGIFRYRFDDSNLSVNAAVGTNQTFRPAADLREGRHFLCVQERNQVGHWSASACADVVVDYTAPKAPRVSVIAAPANTRSPQWTWEGGGGGSGMFKYRLDTAAWSFEDSIRTLKFIGLSDGFHFLYVQERDFAGNWSSVSIASAAIDSTPPNAVVLSNQPSSPNNNPRPSWSWRSGGNGGAGFFRIRLHLYSQSANLAGIDTLSDTLFTPASDLPHGDYVFEVQERDSLANWSATVYSFFTIDRTPPSAPIVTTSPPSPTNVARPTWLWSSGGGGDSTFRIRLNDSDLTAGTETASRDFTPAADLPDGLHTLYVQERDAAGNWSAVGRATIQVEKNRLMAPTVSVSPTSPAANTRPTWSWMGNAGGVGTYRFKLDDSSLTSGSTVSTQTTFSPAWDLSDGSHVLYVQQQDESGRWSFTGRKNVEIFSAANMASPHVGWAVGNNGTILKTSNGGVTWTSQASGTTRNLFAVFFVDGNNGWTVGDAGVVRKTSNGGASWDRITIDSTINLSSVTFVDANTGWIVGTGGSIWKTSNGGASWIKQSGATNESLYSIDFVDRTQGWIAGNSGTLLHTIDGGTNWIQQSTQTSDLLGSIRFFDSTTGWILANTAILFTKNGGINWTPWKRNSYPILFSISTSDAETGWAVGGDPSGGSIVRLNAVDTSVQEIRTASRLYACFFTNKSIGWVAGENGQILKTIDGGSSWIAQDSRSVVPLTSIIFLPSDTKTFPIQPIVSVAADTNTPLPSWNWASGGNGLGIYRYKLDDPDLSSGTIQTTYSRYLPSSELTEGLHLLYVQEMGEGAAWSAAASAKVNVDLTPPNAPGVAAPASLTNNPRPTWTWTSGGGGNGTYRYKLNDLVMTSGATTTTIAFYGPGSDLVDGTYTLYVQERDAAGNWSSTGKAGVVVDRLRPGAPVFTVQDSISTSLRPVWKWSSGGGGNGIYRCKLNDSLFASGALLLDSSRYSPPADLAEGSHTLFIQERDEAGNWSPTAGATINVVIATADTGWIVGLGGMIRKTIDGGATWKTQNSGTPNTLNSVSCVNSMRCWAVGGGGTMVRTQDGGSVWSAGNIGTNGSLTSVQFLDPDTGWAVGAQGMMAKSVNGGANWTFRQSRTDRNLASVSFANTAQGWAPMESDTILAIIDTGAWKQVNPGTGPLRGVFFQDASRGWVVGDGGTVLRTADGGMNWVWSSTGTGHRLYAVHFINADTGWAAGEVGRIFKTTDGGATWTQQSLVTTAAYYFIHFKDANSGWAAGSGGTVVRTLDGGSTWRRMITGTTANINGAWIR